MVKEWFFSISIIFLISSSMLAQSNNIEEEFKEYGLSFKVQSIVLLPYNDGSNGNLYNTNYELENNSFIYGFNGELNYYLNPNFGLGIGLGYENLNQPNITYYPLYLNIISALDDSKNTVYAKVNFGIQLGNLDKSGFLFRGGLGYRLKVYKNILSNFEFSYSYQNIYKSFKNSQRPENYYNVESIGLTIGIEIN